jgi:hypothetical protein
LCATLANSNSFVVAQKGSRMTTALYKTDFHAWTQQQALFLRQEDWEKLDWFHLNKFWMRNFGHERFTVYN